MKFLLYKHHVLLTHMIFYNDIFIAYKILKMKREAHT